ncbi:MAG: cell division protein FtsA [Patescibacteria group bacterium]
MNYIVGLDIGSQNIKTAVAEVKRDNKLNLIRVFRTPCQGIRKGVVDDIAEVTRSLNLALNEVKKISNQGAKNIFVSVGSHDVRTQSSRGIVAVSRANYEIYQDDIDRAVEASRAVNLPPNRLVLHALTQEYIVDGVGQLSNPLGMVGNKLEVNSLIVDAFSPNVKNITKCVEIAGGVISGAVFSPLACSRSVLSKNQKELGVVAIDIGFSKTGLAVFEENKLLHAAVFPIGAGNVTNDLAIGMKSSIAIAEMVKLSFGSALAREVPSRETIDLRKIDPAARGAVSRRYISEIIEVRLAEVFEFVDNELKKIGRSHKLPAGSVIVGGGSKIPGLVDLAKQELKLSAQIGVPDASQFDLTGSKELLTQIEDPEYACVLGLLLLGNDQAEPERRSSSGGNIFKRALGYFLP